MCPPCSLPHSNIGETADSGFPTFTSQLSPTPTPTPSVMFTASANQIAPINDSSQLRQSFVLPDPVAAHPTGAFFSFPSLPVPVFSLLSKPCASSHGLVIADHFYIFLPCCYPPSFSLCVCVCKEPRCCYCPPSPSSLPPPRARIEASTQRTEPKLDQPTPRQTLSPYIRRLFL